MAITDIGDLLGADEGLSHQIVDTFATVSQNDRSLKTWGSGRSDGSLKIAFGLRDGDAVGDAIMESLMSGLSPEFGLLGDPGHRVSSL